MYKEYTALVKSHLSLKNQKLGIKRFRYIMPLIAEYIVTVLRNRRDAAKVAEVRAKVAQLCAKFPVYANLKAR